MDRSQATLRRMTNGILLQTKADVTSELRYLNDELRLGERFKPKRPKKDEGYLNTKAYTDWQQTQEGLNTEATELSEYMSMILREMSRRDILQKTMRFVGKQHDVHFLEPYWTRNNEPITEIYIDMDFVS